MMGIRPSRRAFLSLAALVTSAVTTSATAQFGGRSRERGGSGSMRSAHPGYTTPRNAVQPVLDPLAAIERELPSLRIDLKLTPEQAPFFDSYERQVRNAANAERMRPRHLSAFRTDDGNTVKASAVLGTIADDDTQRAEAARAALENMEALYAALTPDQRKQFDARVIQSLREPLGSS